MTYEQFVTSLEIARIALSKFKSYLGNELDLNDEYLTEVSQNLNYYLDNDLAQIQERLELLQCRIDEAFIEWRPNEAFEQIEGFEIAIASALEKSKLWPGCKQITTTG